MRKLSSLFEGVQRKAEGDFKLEAAHYPMTCIALFLVVTLAVCFFPASAAAYGFTVTSLSDLGDANLDGTCGAWHVISIDPLQFELRCTLRAALEEIQDGGTGVNTVTFDPTLSGAITLSSDLPSISKNVTITGPGADAVAIDGDLGQRIFSFSASPTVVIEDLTLMRGAAVSGGAVYQGGGSLILREVMMRDNLASSNGGGVYCSGCSLTIQRSMFIDNGAEASGGAVFATSTSPGSLVVEDSFFGKNTAGGSGGAIWVDYMDLSTTRAVFRDNIAAGISAGGGALAFNSSWNFGGSLATLTDTIVAGNSTSARGGGIFLSGNVSSLAKFLRTTISGNASSVFGGGVNCEGLYFIMANSTLSGNSTNGFGGGIYNSACQASLANVTITENIANADASGGGSGGGLYGNSDMKNSIVAQNIARVSTGADCGGVIWSDGKNIIGTGEGCSIQPFGIDTVGGMYFIDPYLDPLRLDGGITPTHAEQSGSPSRNYVGGDCTWDDDADIGTPEVTLSQDQRQRARDALCDSGSFEYSHCDNGIADSLFEDGVDCGGTCPPCSCPGQSPAHIRPGTFYGTVQTAYDMAYPGALIKVLKLETPVSLDLDRDIYLRYSLGEDCSWFKSSGATPFLAPFIIAKGVFVLEAGTMIVK